MIMVKFFNNFLLTEDGKMMFMLTLIASTMILDFISGVIAAKIQKKFRSKEGINGILRKICSMLLLIIFIPFSVIIPNNVGISLVWVLYVGYEIMELKSVLENLAKMGCDITLFKNFLDKSENEIKK